MFDYIRHLLYFLPFWAGHKSTGNRIPFSLISRRLKEAISENIDEIGRRVLIPNTFKIYFGRFDRAQRINIEDILIKELEEELNSISKEWVSSDYTGKFSVEICEDDTLEQGKFYIECTLDRGMCMLEEEYGEQEISHTLIEEHEEPACDSSLNASRKFLPFFSNEAVEAMQNSGVEESKIYIARISYSGREKYFELKKDTNTIGRSERCDICLGCSDTAVSRRHIELEVKDERIILKPLGINGTYVNGEKVEIGKEREIYIQDVIKVGEYKIEIKIVVFSK